MGTLVLNGATSGSTTLSPVDAVTATITLPSATATLATLGANTFVGNQVVTGTTRTNGAATGGSATKSFIGTNAGSGSGTGSSLWLGYDDDSGKTAAISGFYDGAGISMAISTVATAGTGLPQVERVRFASNGYTLFNTTSDPNASVSGVRICGTFGQNFWSSSATTTSNYNQFIFSNSNGTVGSISTSGSATAFNTSSDYRLKTDVAPMTDALSVVAALKPVTFKWRVDGSEGQGFIAHELAEVMPNCVSGEKDAIDKDGKPSYQGVDVSFLVATLTAAIQELSAQNKSQQDAIAELTARIEKLEAK
jgi:hypothetical protein